MRGLPIECMDPKNLAFCLSFVSCFFYSASLLKQKSVLVQELTELLIDRMAIRTGDDEVQTGDQLYLYKKR